MTFAAAAVAFAAWRWWQPPPTVPVVARTVASIEMTYRCEAGHTFTAPGQAEGRLCSTCSAPAYPVTHYECQQHGAYWVAVQFAALPEGGVRPIRWRLERGEWTEDESELVCPRCQTPLVRRPTDPADAAIRSRKKSGG